jgi:dienelactone hydrolase
LFAASGFKESDMIRRLAGFFVLISIVTFCWVSEAWATNFSMLKVDVFGVTIPVYLYKPAGKGPFPLIILSHGSPRTLADRKFIGPDMLHDQAEALATMGAAVAVPIRRGFGGNGAPIDLYKLDCSEPDYYDTGLTSTKDIQATIKAVTADPEIDGSRVVLIGHSAGGFASVAAGSRQKVLGVVSFAGGRGSLQADKVTCEGKLVSAMKRYGATSQAPELWIFSKNDHFFSLRIAMELHDAFVAGGGKAELDIVPAYSSDGHQYIRNISDWTPKVEAFLRQIKFLQ